MGFLWVDGFSFFHCVASSFHSFVTTVLFASTDVAVHEADVAYTSDGM